MCMPSFACLAIHLSCRVLGQVLEWFPRASSGVHYEMISDVLVRRPEIEGDDALISGRC
jgi:hypothetical protein